MASNKQKLVEIARSFSYKLNLGNFSNADFFCSQKAEVLESEAEKKSEQLYEFCKKEVLKSVNKYKIEHPKEETTKTEPAYKKSAQGWVAKSDAEDSQRPPPEKEPPLPIIEE